MSYNNEKVKIHFHFCLYFSFVPCLSFFPVLFSMIYRSARKVTGRLWWSHGDLVYGCLTSMGLPHLTEKGITPEWVITFKHVMTTFSPVVKTACQTRWYQEDLSYLGEDSSGYGQRREKTDHMSEIDSLLKVYLHPRRVDKTRKACTGTTGFITSEGGYVPTCKYTAHIYLRN